MSDRWSGFGGLVTETLGDLRQSREVREAQALEQSRHDEEQARLKRIEDEGNRRFGVEEEWRRDRAQRDEDRQTYEDILGLPPDQPLTENHIRVWNLFNPGSLRTEAGAPGRVFGDPATAPPTGRDDTNVSLGPEVFESAPAQMGERAFGGLFPATSGGETLAGVARGTRDRETGVDLGIAPDARFFAPTPGPAGPTQTYRPQSGAEARWEEERALNETRYQEGVSDREAARLAVVERQTVEDERYDAREERDINRRAEDVEWRLANADTPLPGNVNDAIVALVTQRQAGVSRDQAVEGMFAKNWKNWSSQFPGLQLVDVQNAVDAAWPRPVAGSYFDNFNFGGDVLRDGGERQLTRQQEDDLGTAEVLVERGDFATREEALQSIVEARDSENPEVPVSEVPPAPPAAPPPRGADLGEAQRAREAAGLSPLTPSQQAGFPSPAMRAEAGAARAEEQAAQEAGRQATQEELQLVSASEPPYPMPMSGLRTADVEPVYRALRAVHAESGLEGLLGYVLENRAELQRSRFDVERYIQRIQARIDSA
jgi:hypothetical protein